MKRWHNGLPPVRWPVMVPQLSSDGRTVYPNSVWPARVSCPCKSFSNRQRCRHEKDTKDLMRSLG